MTYKTQDGVTIAPGLRVFTCACKWGTVQPAPKYFEAGWFPVIYDDGTETQMNGDRMATQNLISGRPDPKASR